MRECFLLSLSKTRIILDRDINEWTNIFYSKPSTIAWLEIFGKYLNINLEGGYPKVFFSPKESDWIGLNKLNNKVGVIYGILDTAKKYYLLDKLINHIPNQYNVFLFGTKTVFNGKREVINFTNTTYRKTILNIASCSHIIGTEGSLIHIASSLNLMTLVIDEKNIFIKNAHPNLVRKVKIFSSGDISKDLINNL